MESRSSVEPRSSKEPRSSMRLWSVYDEMGEAYARHAETGPYNALYDRPAVLGELGDVRGRRVLDAACGPGLYTEALLDAGAEVVGFDASAAMVELASARVGSRARIELARLGEPLPFDDASFDRAICALAIHYVDDDRSAFAELHRVLRPGGALVLSAQHPTADWLREGGSYFEPTVETDVWQLTSGPQPVRYWRRPLHDLCGAATDAGFVIDRLVEPRPTEQMRRTAPDDFAKLNREPGFLVLRLRKLSDR